jgi:hypothetical protein
MMIEPRRLADIPTGGEYLDHTGARCRMDALYLATTGIDLTRVVPYIVPDAQQYQPDITMPDAILLLLAVFPDSEILEMSL